MPAPTIDPTSALRYTWLTMHVTTYPDAAAFLRRTQPALATCGAEGDLLLAEGRAYCTLFVDLSNSPAQRVYERAGYRPVCEFREIALEE